MEHVKQMMVVAVVVVVVGVVVVVMMVAGIGKNQREGIDFGFVEEIDTQVTITAMM